jgi:hypothetical protein
VSVPERACPALVAGLRSREAATLAQILDGAT